MIVRSVTIALAIIFVAISVFSCRHKPMEENVSYNSGYPEAVGKILVTKCATASCHDAKSYSGAAGLRLDTWEHLFEGGNTGAFVVPYRSDYSPLLYFVNTDTTLGPVLVPTMPYNGVPLTREEYLTLKTWIDNGAPDKDGAIPFASNASTRQKIYLTHQNSDEVAVVDAEKKVVMRYIHLDKNTQNGGTPHHLRFTDDGKYAYVVMYNGTQLFKIDATTDKVIGVADIPNSGWNVSLPYKNGEKLLVSNTTVGGGSLGFITTGNMHFDYNHPGPGNDFSSPHGMVLDETGDTVLVTGQYNSSVYRFSINKSLYPKEIIIDSTNTAEPHEIIYTPDFGKWAISCQKTGEVRIFQSHTNKRLATITVGKYPQELAVSHKKPYLFVTCMQDKDGIADTNKLGSVYVINYENYNVVAVLKGYFYQPHGIIVDDRNNVFYVASLNDNGLPAHHAVSGNLGWYQAFYLDNFRPVTGRCEVLKSPYSADIRFKSPY